MMHLKQPIYLKQQFMVGFIVISLLSLAVVSEAQSAAEKATIAVMSFTDVVPDRISSERIGLPDVLASRIIEKLSKNQRFTVVERQALRRTVLEQRFSRKMDKTYLDKTLDRAIETMEHNSGTEVDASSYWSNYNDVVKDFQDLGSTVGADFIVLGDLEQVKQTVRQQAIPYSSRGKVVVSNRVDARLRLRIIDAKNGTIAGAASIKTKLSELLFQGKQSDSDEFTFYDHLASLAAAKILDITFPARIVSTDPLIISRGNNDGITPETRFVIYHEGKEIRNKSGLLLARLKNKVGVVDVVNIQETIVIVKPVSGDNFQLNDLAELDTQAMDAKASAGFKRTGRIVAPQAGGKARATLAMGIIHLNQSARTLYGFNQGHLARISDAVIDGLSNSKRFILLEREQVDQILDEKTFVAITSGGDLQAGLSELQGADYLIHGELNNFYIKTTRQKVPYMDEVQVTNMINVDGVFRIVDVHSGAIISAEKIHLKEKIKDIKDQTQIVARMIAQYSKDSVAKIVARLYPIKVMLVADGVVYLNRGADSGLNVGEQFKVMREGQALIDPDTGQSFGRTERKVAMVQVTEVEGARSRAKLLSGSEPLSGDILRKPGKPVKKIKAQVIQPAW